MKIDELSRTYTYRDAKLDSEASLQKYRERRFKLLQAENIPIHDQAKSTLISAFAATGLGTLAFTGVMI